MAGGGAAGAGRRGHAAAQPPAAPGEVTGVATLCHCRGRDCWFVSSLKFFLTCFLVRAAVGGDQQGGVRRAGDGGGGGEPQQEVRLGAFSRVLVSFVWE